MAKISLRIEAVKLDYTTRYVCVNHCGGASLHNRHVYHSIKELHLWNLPCLLNCLDERCLAIHHNWHIHVSVEDTLRDTLLWNHLDHFHNFFYDLWCWYADNLLQHTTTTIRSPRTTHDNTAYVLRGYLKICSVLGSAP